MNNSFKILHIASFQGNVGDNANHQGLRNSLARIISENINYTELEIRKFYQNYQGTDKMKFDSDFANYSNSFDLTIVGGGNFFELWIDNSITGTTIDISNEVIEKINRPFMFFGLGFDPYKGIPGNNIEKFKLFIDKILSKSNFILSVRNDGSLMHIKRFYGKDYLERIYKVPDGGFFIKPKSINNFEIVQNVKNIAINVAYDMRDLRFPMNTPDHINYSQFIDGISSFICDIVNDDCNTNIILVPHIYSDLYGITKILKKLPDFLVRTSLKVSPYLNGNGSENYIFNIYKRSDIVLGMRFHTNVCSIGMSIPTIGLASYPKINDLYSELDLSDRVVNVNMNGFEMDLLEKTKETLINPYSVKSRYLSISNNLKSQSVDFFDNLKSKLLS